MSGGRSPMGRTLVLSFVAVAAAFTISTALAQIYTERIRSAAREITGNSSPSIAYLASLRGTLRRLEVALTDEIDECGRAQCGEGLELVDQLQTLREVWLQYQGLPAFTGELELWPEVDASLGQLDDRVRQAVADVRAGRAQDARAVFDADVKVASDRVDLALAALSEFDRTEGVRLANRIERLARWSTYVSILLVVSSAGLTAIAGTLAVRAVRQFERSLRERSDDLERFAGRVAHDIMSPLASTAAALHVAQRFTAEGGKRSLSIGERGIKRVQLLVTDLLEFARAGASVSTGASADVRGVVEDVVTELHDLAGDRGVSLRIMECEGSIACSAGVLLSILSNLVRNAIVYMGDAPLREVRIRAVVQGDRHTVRVEVEDTGPGIPEELGDSIFEPFVRGPESKESGSGLGLATVKRFVLAHGGRLGYRSTPVAGTTFWLEMPPGPHVESKPTPTNV